MRSAGFIGGGRIARILIGGWQRSGKLPVRVLVHEPDPQARGALTTEVPGVEPVTVRDAAVADVVFVALHPPAIPAALIELKPHFARSSVLVSLAPKLTLAALEQAAGMPRIVRMIPNAPSLVGRGYNPVVFGAGVDDGTRTMLRGLFAPWGQTPEVPESQLEAYAILTGMGPTYFWFQWQALRELAQGFGLTPADTDRALRAMVEGALTTLLEARLTPPATMDLIPVKPLAEMEPAVAAAYRTLLPALHGKIRPADAAAADSAERPASAHTQASFGSR